ncbi:putative monodehydroascorbate reductase (NADH), Carbonic anhydrase [Medicago truncatula]|uniref:Carbonic anhydrase n=1 Tax=Medicago truncatula TaxID=3880 RepID=A0A072TG98_MEDTR|nr:alpha carbonic anhydrase 7 [Medicago truncatula]KEH16352.1 eukaryotic-type carbonic anhydrase [Medicago truncatula]RHN60705.1 putative monodehydroascorbate reductase (NADH), Carbonic anhydrase [Medicago truncatula]
MAKLTSLVLIFSLLTAIVLLSSCPAMSEEVEDETEFNYDEASPLGPPNWGHIKPNEWFLCKNGTMQSPIDLRDEVVQISNLGPLQTNYNPSNATLKNRGHDVKVELMSNSSYLQIDGTQYELLQFHWHTPSEHTINGVRFDLELHLVHQTPLNETAVIGVLYTIGMPDPFLSLLEDDLEAISNNTAGEERAVGVIDPNQINFNTTKYYRYMGSLTTPPCSENVTWTVIKEVKSVSQEQIELLQAAVHDDYDYNARPLQPLNNRLVQLNCYGAGP